MSFHIIIRHIFAVGLLSFFFCSNHTVHLHVLSTELLLAVSILMICIVASEICSLPKDKGPCSGMFVRWFYNSSDQVCQEFAYGGCLGNLNRFESNEKCIEHCLSPTNNDTRKGIS